MFKFLKNKQNILSILVVALVVTITYWGGMFLISESDQIEEINEYANIMQQLIDEVKERQNRDFFVGRYFTVYRAGHVCLNSGIWREFSNHNVIFPRFGCLHSKKRLRLSNLTKSGRAEPPANADHVSLGWKAPSRGEVRRPAD